MTCYAKGMGIRNDGSGLEWEEAQQYATLNELLLLFIPNSSTALQSPSKICHSSIYEQDTSISYRLASISYWDTSIYDRDSSIFHSKTPKMLIPNYISIISANIFRKKAPVRLRSSRWTSLFVKSHKSQYQTII